MKYKTLGNIKVSELCFGSLTVGPLQANLPVKRGAEVIAHAFTRGINFIDTAQYYRNYEYIKIAMEMSGHYDVVISSKTYAHTAELAELAVNEACAALGRDYIDIFMLHEQESIHTLRGHIEALEYLIKLQSIGKIRAVGVSTHHVAGVNGVCELVKRGYPIDCVHPIYNYSGLGIADGDRSDMLSAVKLAHNMGIGIFSMKPLAGGHLYNNAPKAFDFVLDCPYIDSVAVGMQSEEEVNANIKYFSDRTFEENLLKRQRRLHIEEYCEGCGKCVTRCGQKALTIKNGLAAVDNTKCVLCGYCSAVCDIFAIKVL